MEVYNDLDALREESEEKKHVSLLGMEGLKVPVCAVVDFGTVCFCFDVGGFCLCVCFSDCMKKRRCC